MDTHVLSGGDLVQEDAFDEVGGGVDQGDAQVEGAYAGVLGGASGGRESGVAGADHQEFVGHGVLLDVERHFPST